ncbi:hypothetical protein FQN55_000341 [Onygenales sp. PD_40]|nr:hypothetical protein FQN55_000341 [Onygenales sp. PD_40]
MTTTPLYHHAHALVLGASGISGWAFVNQLLHDYPRSGTWAKVTGVTKRPMNAEEISYWPRDDEGRLQLLSGVDFADDTEEEVRGKFVAGVVDVEMVTPVYYLVSPPDAKALDTLRKAVVVIDSLAPNLKFIHLQYGTFIYGTCFADGFYMPVPLSESLPPLRKPWIDQLPYSVLSGWMEKFSVGKSWSWCETRPDEIIGLYMMFMTWRHLQADSSPIGFLPRPNS